MKQSFNEQTETFQKLQWLLSMLGSENEHEDLTPMYWLYTFQTSNVSNREVWSKTVHLIYLCLKSHLIEITPSKYLFEDGIEGFAKNLLNQNPFDNEKHKKVSFWMDPSIIATNYCVGLVNQYKLTYGDDNININFINEIIFLFNGAQPNWLELVSSVLPT